MARVNHKRVKQLIQEKQGKITDQEFFTSRLLAIHLEDLAAAQRAVDTALHRQGGTASTAGCGSAWFGSPTETTWPSPTT